MKPLPYEVKLRIAKAIQAQELPRPDIAKAFSCSIDTVNAIASRLKRGISLEPKLHLRGRKRKLDDEAEKAVIKYYSDHPDATLSEGINALGLKVSVATLCRCLHRNKFSYKKKSVYATERSRPNITEQRQQWQKVIQIVPPATMWFLDESATNLNMTRRYAWGKTHDRVFDAVPVNTPISRTVLAAFTVDGRVVSVNYQGGTTSQRLFDFLYYHLLPAMNPEEVLVMDNHAAHHSRLVTNLLNNKRVRSKYLPSYSPDLNPIEKMWSKMKAIIRGLKPRDGSGLQAAIQKALAAVRVSDCVGWFRSCGLPL